MNTFSLRRAHETSLFFPCQNLTGYLDKFLELKRRRPDEFWVPTYDIDCIWHAHQLHPQAYVLDPCPCWKNTSIQVNVMLEITCHSKNKRPELPEILKSKLLKKGCQASIVSFHLRFLLFSVHVFVEHLFTPIRDV